MNAPRSTGSGQAGMVSASELTAEQRAVLTTPYGFGKFFLGLPIYDAPVRKKVGECRDEAASYYDIFENDGQRRVLDDLDPQGAKVAVRTANGAGKTTILIPAATLWFMSLFPRAKVVITSGVDRQVREQIFPALRAPQRRLGGWTFHDASIEAPNGSTCVGFTTRDGGHFEGWHGNKDALYDLLQHDGPLMIVVDEAKSVEPQIHDAIERCTYQRLFMASSCGAALGAFHDAFGKNARYFRTHRIAAGDCPHADHAKNLELIQRRGVQDPLVQSKVFAEFMGSAEGAVIKLEWLPRCREGARKFEDGAARYFCDFAAGGDENVLAEVRGNKARIVAAWREQDTMRACGEFIRLFRGARLTQAAVAECVRGDNGGGGQVMLDRLHELGWAVQRDNAGERAENAENYFNRSAETWCEGAKAIERGEIILPDDDTLAAQLTSRKEVPRSDGRRQLESKEQMRKRGVGSPDRADAVLGALRLPRRTAPVGFAGPGRDLSLCERMFEEAGVSRALAGANCE
jgi:phage terminase large subunit